MKNRFKSTLYTEGKFGKGYRETMDTKNPYLFAFGRWPTKITPDILPEEYLKIRSRSIWYMTGYVRTSGIVDIKYYWSRWNNHLFKDDYLFISYDKPITLTTDQYGSKCYEGYDLKFCGDCIIPIILAAEKHSGYDSIELRKEIEIRRRHFWECYPYEYDRQIGDEDIDLFEWWQKYCL